MGLNSNAKKYLLAHEFGSYLNQEIDIFEEKSFLSQLYVVTEVVFTVFC